MQFNSLHFVALNFKERNSLFQSHLVRQLESFKALFHYANEVALHDY